MKSDFTVIHSSILHLKQNGLSKFEIQTHYSFQQSHPRFQLTVFYHINYMVHIGERYFLIDPVNQFDRLFCVDPESRNPIVLYYDMLIIWSSLDERKFKLLQQEVMKVGT